MMKVWLSVVLACIFFTQVFAGCNPVTSNGKTYTLGPLTQTKDYTGTEVVGSTTYTYQFNFCQNIAQQCSKPAPVAQFNGGNCVSATGLLPAVLGEMAGGNGVWVNYTNDQDKCGNPKTINRVSSFQVKCDPNVATYTLDSINEPGVCQYVFLGRSKYGCPGTSTGSNTGASTNTGASNTGASSTTSGPNPPKHKSKGLSPGSIFLIVFFVSFALYFIVGGIFKWKRYDAHGVDIIPNVEFWADLPGLMKDGCLFVKNKITGRLGYSSL